MITFYILNTVLLVVAIIAITMQFLLARTQRAMNDLNSVILSINDLFKKKRICCIDEYGTPKAFTVNSQYDKDMNPILCINIIDNTKIDEDGRK